MDEPQPTRPPAPPTAPPSADATMPYPAEGVVARRRTWTWQRIVLVTLAVLVGLPLLFVLGMAAHLWSAAGELADHRPSEPSRLYARPLELAVGDAVSRQEVVAELEALHYREVELGEGDGDGEGDAPETRRRLDPGTWAAAGDGIEIALRSPRPAPGGAPEAVGGGGVDRPVVGLEWDGDTLSGLVLDGVDAPEGHRLALEPPLLATFYGPDLRESRPLDLEELPEHVVHAVLAAEDRKFFEHEGLAWLGILRAAWVNFQAGEVVQGGSTITQQLAKNVFLGPERTWKRKSREAVLALLIEARFGKRRILETYLDEIYLGKSGPANLMGLGAAAWAYYGKEPTDLDLGEAATLAGMIRSPGAGDPVGDPAAARERRDWVLARMAERGWIDEPTRRREIARAVAAHPVPMGERLAPYFAAAAAREASSRFEVEELGGTGYRLYGTLALRDQRRAEAAVAWGLERLESGWERGRADGDLQAALVSLDPANGEVLAYQGGRDFAASEFDRAGQGRRQAGSVFKPVVYSAALASGLGHPGDQLRDVPVRVRFGNDEWRPRNSDRAYRGEVSVRASLEQSLNIPTVRLAMNVGLGRVRDQARAMGVESPIEAWPALSLGAVDLTPLEVATIYATLANGGRRPTPHTLLSVHDADGAAIGGEPLTTERVLDPESAYLVTSMLQGVLDRGTAWSARKMGVRGPLAGKTGTSNDRQDAWFAGYSPQRVGVVWVGYDDSRETELSGARGALPIWGRFMMAVAPPGGYDDFQRPATLREVTVCLDSGQRAVAACPNTTTELYRAYAAPVMECPLHDPPAIVAGLYGDDGYDEAIYGDDGSYDATPYDEGAGERSGEIEIRRSTREEYEASRSNPWLEANRDRAIAPPPPPPGPVAPVEPTTGITPPGTPPPSAPPPGTPPPTAPSPSAPPPPRIDPAAPPPGPPRVVPTVIPPPVEPTPEATEDDAAAPPVEGDDGSDDGAG